MGYLNKENETKEVMTADNWLKLGDLGFLDEDSFLSVLGKEENFITLTTGEVISPLRVRYSASTECYDRVNHEMLFSDRAKNSFGIILHRSSNGRGRSAGLLGRLADFADQKGR